MLRTGKVIVGLRVIQLLVVRIPFPRRYVLAYWSRGVLEQEKRARERRRRRRRLMRKKIKSRA